MAKRMKRQRSLLFDQVEGDSTDASTSRSQSALGSQSSGTQESDVLASATRTFPSQLTTPPPKKQHASLFGAVLQSIQASQQKASRLFSPGGAQMQQFLDDAFFSSPSLSTSSKGTSNKWIAENEWNEWTLGLENESAGANDEEPAPVATWTVYEQMTLQAHPELSWRDNSNGSFGQDSLVYFLQQASGCISTRGDLPSPLVQWEAALYQFQHIPSHRSTYQQALKNLFLRWISYAAVDSTTASCSSKPAFFYALSATCTILFRYASHRQPEILLTSSTRALREHLTKEGATLHLLQDLQGASLWSEDLLILQDETHKAAASPSTQQALQALRREQSVGPDVAIKWHRQKRVPSKAVPPLLVRGVVDCMTLYEYLINDDSDSMLELYSRRPFVHGTLERLACCDKDGETFVSGVVLPDALMELWTAAVRQCDEYFVSRLVPLAQPSGGTTGRVGVASSTRLDDDLPVSLVVWDHSKPDKLVYKHNA